MMRSTLLLLLVFLLLAGCKTVTITTVVHSDQSIERLVSVEGDSASADETGYPFPLVGSWSSSRKRDEADSTKYVYTRFKSFRRVEQLNQEFPVRQDTVQVNTQVRLQKKFRWFYSFYHYEETYYAFSPFRLLKLEDYLTLEELKIYQIDQDSSVIKDKVEDFESRVVFEEFYQTLLRAVKDSPQHEEMLPLIEKQEDELYELVKSELSFDEDQTTPGMQFLVLADKLLKPAHSFVALHPAFAGPERKFRELLEFYGKDSISGDTFHHVVIMPGRVIDTNANHSIKTSEVAWEFGYDRFPYQNMVMWVESRKLNGLPMVLTGLLLLAGLIMLWISAGRARRKKLAAQGIAWENRRRFILKWWISVLLMVTGLGMIGWFLYMFIIFNTEPMFALLNFLHATPRDNAMFISLIAVGVILFVIGFWHLVVWAKLRKRRLEKASRNEE
ncbi:MAG: hypothetical protein EHM72_08155 [Calditrichaeota bacterium]|nr:MAG: hypothetical protein EHM72_08155 [Calditrichota bacterium]